MGDFLSSSFFQTLLATLVSIAAGWTIAWSFYRKATLDLVEESRELQRLLDLILRALENAGMVKYNRDQAGKITGLVIELSGTAFGSSSTTANLTVDGSVTHRPPTNPSSD